LAEALITEKLELTLSKSQILEIYLNSIDWGRGLFGIQEATQYYFKKKPTDLTLKESVFLAAIIPNPTRFSSLDEEQNPKLFVRKQITKALEGLFQAGVISVGEYEQALVEPISINP
jgi:membrane peptidoglycan carboxypeptidase